MTTPELNADDDRLTAYALGELDEAARLEFDAELSESPHLQRELAELQELTGLLRVELAAESNPSLTEDQRQRLLNPVATIPLPVNSAAAAVLPVVPIGGIGAQVASADQARRRRVRRWAEIALGGAVAIGAANHWLTPQFAGTDLGLKYSQVCDAETRLQIQGSRSDIQVEQRTDDLAVLTASDPIVHNSTIVRGNSTTNERGFVNVSKNDPQTSPHNSSSPSSLITAVDSSRSMSVAEGTRPTLQVPVVTGPISQGLVQHDLQPAHGKPVTRGTANHPVERNFSGLADIKFDNAASGRMSSDAKPLVSARGRLSVVDGLSNEGRYYEREGEITSQSDPRSGETYEAPAENPFLTPSVQPLSTFSIDVDSASYANVRRFLTQGQLPPPNAVRLEEMVNYFTYDYPRPKEGEPFSVTADAAPCPWQREHYLARIALQARTIDKAKRPPTNLVFLLDVSGSMQAANKLPLVKQAMTMLAEELNERDRIAIVTYAGDAGVKLASTPGSDQTRIMQSIEALHAGGSTNGAAGINLAYEEALRHFNGEGENRVILCTDGDFNVGVSNDDQLVELIQQQAKTKVFLSIFGFGMGNLKDAKLEKLADKGNGHYGYIDDLREARRVFNEELVGTLYTVAKDVKIQVEFNPLTVGAYRLLGYENRALAAKDFNDDTKDAGEIGAGHTVTALYEIVPKGKWQKTQAVDRLKYTAAADEPAAADLPVRTNIPPEAADDLFTVKLRFKQPTADTSVKTIDYVVDDIAGKKIVLSADFLWAASVASFGMHLKHSSHQGQWSLADLYETAQGAKGADANGRRREFLDLVQAAQRLEAGRSAPK